MRSNFPLGHGAAQPGCQYGKDSHLNPSPPTPGETFMGLHLANGRTGLMHRERFGAIRVIHCCYLQETGCRSRPQFPLRDAVIPGLLEAWTPSERPPAQHGSRHSMISFRNSVTDPSGLLLRYDHDLVKRAAVVKPLGVCAQGVCADATLGHAGEVDDELLVPSVIGFIKGRQ